MRRRWTVRSVKRADRLYIALAVLVARPRTVAGISDHTAFGDANKGRSRKRSPMSWQ